jgi:hypothetical protein
LVFKPFRFLHFLSGLQMQRMGKMAYVVFVLTLII